MSRLPTCPPGTCDLTGRRVRFAWGMTGWVFGCKACHYVTATVSPYG